MKEFWGIRGWKAHSENKYLHLLVLLIGFFIAFPFIDILENHSAWIATVFFVAMITTLRALNLKRQIFLTCSLIGGVALLLNFASDLIRAVYIHTDLTMTAMGIYAVFLLYSIGLMSQKMFSTSKVTGDVLRGGISIYLLLGYLWTIFYFLIHHFDPQAFATLTPWKDGYLFYFSFTTLTTLGYGDIYPVNRLAMSLANLEAIVGQLYISIFVARLVGLHIVHQVQRSVSD